MLVENAIAENLVFSLLDQLSFLSFLAGRAQYFICCFGSAMTSRALPLGVVDDLEEVPRAEGFLCNNDICILVHLFSSFSASSVVDLNQVALLLRQHCVDFVNDQCGELA